MSTLSVYAKGLPEGATEARYLEKIRVIGVDPFIFFSGGNGTDITRASLPPVDSSSDIVSYFVLQTSFITYLNVLVLLLYYVYCYYYNVQHNLLLIL